MQYWLMKSEPQELSINDLMLKPNGIAEWFGVRNYQARNYMYNQMQIGDMAFFWHSSCKDPGIYGVVQIVTNAHPDSHQFSCISKYYDPKSTQINPRWWCVDVKFEYKTRYISIAELKTYPQLESLKVLQRGNRLSITPIRPEEWQFIINLNH